MLICINLYCWRVQIVYIYGTGTAFFWSSAPGTPYILQNDLCIELSYTCRSSLLSHQISNVTFVVQIRS